MRSKKDYIDFPNTCPYLDDSITHVVSELKEFICEIFEDQNIDISNEKSLRMAEAFYKSSIEKHFEDVRVLNSRLRDQATNQLKDLLSERDELKFENDRLERVESDLEYQIDVLKERVSELELSAQEVRDE